MSSSSSSNRKGFPNLGSQGGSFPNPSSDGRVIQEGSIAAPGNEEGVDHGEEAAQHGQSDIGGNQEGHDFVLQSTLNASSSTSPLWRSGGLQRLLSMDQPFMGEPALPPAPQAYNCNNNMSSAADQTLHDVISSPSSVENRNKHPFFEATSAPQTTKARANADLVDHGSIPPHGNSNSSAGYFSQASQKRKLGVSSFPDLAVALLKGEKTGSASEGPKARSQSASFPAPASRFRPIDGSVSNQLPPDYVPGPYDVVCLGRGKSASNYVGNRRFHVTVMMHLDRYENARSKMDKTVLVSEIVDIVRESSLVGGFIRQDRDGRWYEVGDAIAREKVGQALRNALAEKNKDPATKGKHKPHQEPK